MSTIINDAVVKLQQHALALTDVKAAPDRPVEDAAILPLSIAHIMEGTAQADDATTARLLLTVGVDIHVNRGIMKLAYKQLDELIPEFLKKLAGDPTLGGTVDTIVFPVTFTVTPAIWDKIVTQMVSFRVQLKFREDIP